MKIDKRVFSKSFRILEGRTLLKYNIYRRLLMRRTDQVIKVVAEE
jgi:hypothetical protein